MLVSRSLPLAYVGTSFRKVGFDGLSRFVIAPDDRARLGALRAAARADGLVYVQTCNRVEAYFAIPADGYAAADLAARVAALFGAEPQDLDVRLGAEALEHLLNVVSSLDSLVIGEFEIAGQVRRAADRARTLNIDGPFLRKVFDRALSVAKRVRIDTAIGQTPVSVASLCAKKIREHLGHDSAGARVALFGVGEVTRKVALSLAGRGVKLLFVNRTVERAAEIAAEVGGEALSLDEFHAAPLTEIDVLVAATAAPTYIITPRCMEYIVKERAPGRKPVLLCDLAMPRNVDPACEADPRMKVETLAHLETVASENRARLEGEIDAVRAIVRDEVEKFLFQYRVREIADKRVDALLNHDLKHLRTDDQELIRSFANQLAERFARQPKEVCAA